MCPKQTYGEFFTDDRLLLVVDVVQLYHFVMELCDDLRGRVALVHHLL